ncbi:MAG: CoA-binding protein [Thermoflavifilum sp.]|nr:CoA-binding protein [Thermoflavifilum sp.]MCL6514382.1 CoA-binding protein [Alicyclobacillus sp.]
MQISDQAMKDLMMQTHTIAVVGLANRPGSPAYDVASYQQSQGYHVIPVHPQTGMALGHKGVKQVSDSDEPVDIVHVFGHVQDAKQLAEQAKQKGAKAVWLQPGVDEPELESYAQSQGLQVIKGRCFKREHMRLLGRAPM